MLGHDGSVHSVNSLILLDLGQVNQCLCALVSLERIIFLMFSNILRVHSLMFVKSLETSGWKCSAV